MDDDLFCRALFYRHMLNLGFSNITVFDNGNDCLDQLNERPDIIFLDYNMKPYDGLNLMHRIKQIRPESYVILISGQKEIQVAVDALKSGAFDYIIKGEKELEMITQATDKIRSMAMT